MNSQQKGSRLVCCERWSAGLGLAPYRNPWAMQAASGRDKPPPRKRRRHTLPRERRKAPQLSATANSLCATCCPCAQVT